MLARALENQRVRTLFALPGVQLDFAFDALYDTSIRALTARHEQATAYMADGFARTTGEPGVCMVVPGPGLLNASAALATAYACSSPVVCITGQIDSRGIDANFGLLHEIPHQERVLESLTKWSGRAMQPCDIPALVREAFVNVQSDRPRPVALELPPDVLQREQAVQDAEPAGSVHHPSPDPDLLRQAAN